MLEKKHLEKQGDIPEEVRNNGSISISSQRYSSHLDYVDIIHDQDIHKSGRTHVGN